MPSEASALWPELAHSSNTGIPTCSALYGATYVCITQLVALCDAYRPAHSQLSVAAVGPTALARTALLKASPKQSLRQRRSLLWGIEALRWHLGASKIIIERIMKG